jgi:hypothetical protein
MARSDSGQLVAQGAEQAAYCLRCADACLDIATNGSSAIVDGERLVRNVNHWRSGAPSVKACVHSGHERVAICTAITTSLDDGWRCDLHGARGWIGCAGRDERLFEAS